MMAFAVTYNFTGSTSLSAAELDQNFTDIENKINGNITGTNISPSAAIAVAQLACNYYEIVIPFSLHGTELNAAVTADLVIGSVPYYSASSIYYIRGIEQMFMLDTGAAITNLIFTLEYGNVTDGWTTIKAGIDVGAADNTAFVTALAVSQITTSATRPKFFRANVTQAGVNYAAGDSFCLSILLNHTIR